MSCLFIPYVCIEVLLLTLLQHHNQEEIAAYLDKLKEEAQQPDVVFGHLSITGAKLNNTSTFYTGVLGAHNFADFKV